MFKLILIDNVVSLRAGYETFLIVKVKKQSRTEDAVDLRKTVSKRLFINIESQGKIKCVPKEHHIKRRKQLYK